MSYTIRNLESYDEMVMVHHLQQEIWGLDDPTVGLYPPLLASTAKHGGIVLGAFDSVSGDMVAFLFSFIGREGNGPFKLYSQAMGVRQQWRGRGIAESLKRTQRERTIAAGLPLITWTYDPLETPNAHLNVHKLRTVSRRYLRNIYGTGFGALNEGLPTDRLFVEAWVNGERAEEEPYIDWDLVDEAEPIFETMGQGPTLQVVQANLALSADTIQMAIPASIHPIKISNMDLAMDWRMKVRKAFETYFSKDYILTDFISITGRNGERRNRYLLQKLTPELEQSIGLQAAY